MGLYDELQGGTSPSKQSGQGGGSLYDQLTATETPTPTALPLAPAMPTPPAGDFSVLESLERG